MAKQRLSIAELDRHFEKLLRKFPGMLEIFYQRVEPQLEAAVRQTVGGSGKVASWQEGAIGSYGRYAAVHPKPKTFYSAREGGKKYAVGAITNAITSGHKSRSGDRVLGKHYYERAMIPARAILEKEVRALEKDIKGAVNQWS